MPIPFREARFQSTDPDREVNRTTRESLRVARQIRRDAIARQIQQEAVSNQWNLHSVYPRGIDSEEEEREEDDGYAGDDEGEGVEVPLLRAASPFLRHVELRLEVVVLRVVEWRQRGLNRVGEAARRVWKRLRPLPSSHIPSFM